MIVRLILCPELTPTSTEREMEHVQQWAASNKMLLNLIKTKEMIFHRPNPRLIVFPAELPGIERVNKFKLLGVVFQPDFQFSEYISTLITTCNQRLYLLVQLKRQGLGLAETDMVFKAIILSKITYVLPALVGYFNESQIKQVCAIFNKAKRWQLITENYDFNAIAESLQSNLFQQSKSCAHCLNHLYEPSHNISLMTLRDRGHKFYVPFVKYDHSSKHFV